MDERRGVDITLSEVLDIRPACGPPDVDPVVWLEDVLRRVEYGKYHVSIRVAKVGGEGESHVAAAPSEAADELGHKD